MMMKRIGTHFFVQMTKPTLQSNFTSQQLSKLHLIGFHPSFDNLFNLIRLYRPDESHTETIRIL